MDGFATVVSRLNLRSNDNPVLETHVFSMHESFVHHLEVFGCLILFNRYLLIHHIDQEPNTHVQCRADENLSKLLYQMYHHHSHGKEIFSGLSRAWQSE